VKIIVCLHASPPGGQPLADNDREAIRLARALGEGHEVIALLAGTKEETAPLEAALLAGVDRAARVSGESFAAADFHTLGQVLGSAARTLGPDLILGGARSDTDGLGALTASIARHTGLPHLANIESLALSAVAADGGRSLPLTVTVRGEGRKRRLAVGLPFVMSVVRGAAAAAIEEPTRPGAPGRSIETLAIFDPEVTVIRRRTEILGTSTTAERPVKTVGSAAELVAGLIQPGPSDPPAPVRRGQG
jgi:electron transfer flavoprotein alpha/beta subunit